MFGMEQKNLFDSEDVQRALQEFGSPQVAEIADKTVRDNLHKAFDSVEAEQLKREGMDEAARKRADILLLAKPYARRFAEWSGTCCADDVLRYIMGLGYSPADLGNAAGSIFRGPEWEFTGTWIPSNRTSNHRRYLRVWRLKGTLEAK